MEKCISLSLFLIYLSLNLVCLLLCITKSRSKRSVAVKPRESWVVARMKGWKRELQRGEPARVCCVGLQNA